MTSTIRRMACRLVLQKRLKLRMEVKEALGHHGKSARRRCNYLNANKSGELPRISYKRELAQAAADFRASAEYVRLTATIDRLLARGPQAEQNNSYLSEIYNEQGESQFSKNEVIAAPY